MSATSAFIATIERGQARSRVCETSTGLLVPQGRSESVFPPQRGGAGRFICRGRLEGVTQAADTDEEFLVFAVSRQYV